LKAFLICSALAPPPTSRLFAGQLDDVHRGHGEPRAVDHAADGAVQPDVVEGELGRLDLERILLGEVAQLFQIRMAEERVVIERDLGVEGEEIARLGEDERIDLDHRGIGVDEGLVERSEHLRQLPGGRAVQPHAEGELARLERRHADAGVERLAENLLRLLGRDLLDVHAARGAGNDDRAAAGAIDEQADVELAVDLQPLFDQHTPDLLPFGAGLVRNQRHAEHLLGELLGFVRGLGELHAATLAAAACMNLRFHDNDAAATAAGQPLRDVTGLGRGRGHFPSRHRDAEAREDGLGLILVDFHRKDGASSERRK
jgi:hypothetical protein